MNEKQFIEKNKDDWGKLEEILKHNQRNPEELHQLFVKVSGDLSYAQTYFPRRSIRWYLNSLVNGVFDSMRTKPKINLFDSLIRFYSYTLPNVIIKHKYAFIVSFFIFSISLVIGIYSTVIDPEFPKLILGRDYIDMTEENIAKGDPMAVYKEGTRYGSFLGITLNNVMVALRTYVFGIFAAIGSLFILIYNGIMLGAFQTFFYNKEILSTSMLTIWIHGTIEISSIIIAGAASIILGKSLIAPHTYTRIQSLRIGAIESIYVILSTIPLFLVAGFLEGYVTPQTDLPDIIKLCIIILSAIFMVGVYIVRPYFHSRYGLYNPNEVTIKFGKNNYSELNDDNSVAKNAFIFIHKNLGSIFQYIIIPSTLVAIPIFYAIIYLRVSYFDFSQYNDLRLDYKSGGIYLVVFEFISILYFYASFMTLIKKEDISFKDIFNTLLSHLISLSIIAGISTSLIFIKEWYITLVLYLIFPWAIFNIYILKSNETESKVSQLFNSFKEAFNVWGSTLITIVLLTLLLVPSGILLDLGLKRVSATFLSWHEIFSDIKLKAIYIENVFSYFFIILYSVLCYVILHFKYLEILNTRFSIDLKDNIKNFGTNKSIA